jgi:hypothetical protein
MGGGGTEARPKLDVDMTCYTVVRMRGGSVTSATDRRVRDIISALLYVRYIVVGIY